MFVFLHATPDLNYCQFIRHKYNVHHQFVGTEPEYAQFLKSNSRTGMLFPSSKLKTDVLVNLLSEPSYCTFFLNFILVLVLSWNVCHWTVNKHPSTGNYIVFIEFISNLYRPISADLDKQNGGLKKTNIFIYFYGFFSHSRISYLL